MNAKLQAVKASKDQNARAVERVELEKQLAKAFRKFKQNPIAEAWQSAEGLMFAFQQFTKRGLKLSDAVESARNYMTNRYGAGQGTY